MACKHERVKSVNCVFYCMDCGAELPQEALFPVGEGKNTAEEEKPSEAPKQPEKRTRKKKDE